MTPAAPDLDTLDLATFRLLPGMTAPAKPKKRPPRFLRGEFLRGPIPWPWLLGAMALPGQALAVGLILWREAGIENNRTLSVNHALFGKCGIKPGASRFAMENLEHAGLIAVQRPPGRNQEVTILESAAERNGKA
jgi:hypothetical protein